jgi:V-type H+-transporting ATPase subunit a
MSLGIFLKAFNAIHFGSALDFIFEFLPQITLMMVTFGYMDFLIFLKWATSFWTLNSETKVFYDYDAQYAPSIITLLINMPLKLGAC